MDKKKLFWAGDIGKYIEPSLPTNKKKIKCSKCGVEFDNGPIYYSCNKNGCPLFPQIMC